MLKRERVEHIMSLQPLYVNPNELKDSLGAVVNINGEHWVALRWLRNSVWLLDSLKTPQRLTWSQYENYISEHHHPEAYPIKVAAQIS
jgi:predicted phosphatase